MFIPFLLHLQWEPDTQMIRMTVGAVWALRAFTQTDSFTPISCHLPHLTSSISQKTHRALRTHKELACQRGHSLVWQREGQMALNHTSSSGHLIKRQKFVCVVETPTDRPPNSSNTPPLRVNGVHSSHRLVQPMTKHDTYKQNTGPTPPRVTSPLSTDRLFPSTSPLTPYLKV